MKKCFSVALYLFLMLVVCKASSEEKAAIESRLNELKSWQSVRLESLHPLEKDLIFLADFEQDNLVYLKPDRFIRVNLLPDHYRAGRSGRGYFFEKPRQNLLPLEVADVEKNAAAFQSFGGAGITVVTASTPVGKRCLSLTCPAGQTGLTTGPWPVSWKNKAWHEKEWTLLASCYVKGPSGARIKMEVTFEEKELVLKPAKKGEQEEPARIPDKTGPQEITLTGQWQRIASWVSGDMRLKERQATVKLTYLGENTVTLFLDGFQLEQAKYYPYNHLMPTSWVPGGTFQPATLVKIDTPFKEVFPVEQGTIAFWTMTPRESNLNQVGSIYWLSFGSGWNYNWSMSTYRFTAGGEGFCYFTTTNAADGNWHHVAMVWDQEKVQAYLDGQVRFTFDRKKVDLSGILETYALCLGGSISDGQTANSVMDEVAVWSRKLGEEEIKSLAEGKKLNPGSQLVLSPEGRCVFYRNEEKAEITLVVVDTGKNLNQVRVDMALGQVIYESKTVSLKQGECLAVFTFSPEKLRCGKYLCRFGVKEGKTGAYLEKTVEVVPALREHHFLLSSWGAGGRTAEWRQFFQTLGFNALDTYDLNIEQLGQEGFIYGWHYNFGNGLWSPEERIKVREEARKEAEKRALFPNWKYTLINSEKPPWPVPEEKERRRWFDTWARQELGFPVPEKGWQLGTTHNPISCWFLEEEKPGPDGIYQESKTFTFLKWWYNRGCGWWRINAEAAAEIKKLRPDVKVWTDPLNYPGQIADLDAGSSWSYQIWPEPLIGEFEETYALLRNSSKEFYTTLGMNYVNSVATVTDQEGKKKNLAPTVDDLVQQAWIAVTHFPTHGLHYWDVDAVFYGEKNEKGWYAEPRTAERLGAVWKKDLLPLATMLKGVGNAPRRLALLLPESTLWFDAGEGKWWWGTAHYPNHWKNWVGKMGIPYDIIKDNNIKPGIFRQYQVVIFPMAEYVNQKVYEELMSAAGSGTKIIVDSYCRQNYSGMEKLQQEYFYRMPAEKRKDYGLATVSRLKQIAEELKPQLVCYAVGSSGPVITNVRQAGRVLYVSLINNARKKGPYTEWTKNESFQPYGVQQEVTCYLKVPKESVVYEFTQSRIVPSSWDGSHLVVKVSLPEHAGRLLCVYPESLAKLEIDGPSEVKPGSKAKFFLKLWDKSSQPAPGRQLAEVKVIDSSGQEHDESTFYPLTEGRAEIVVRVGENDLSGSWKIEVRERTSGLTAVKNFTVR